MDFSVHKITPFTLLIHNNNIKLFIYGFKLKILKLKPQILISMSQPSINKSQILKMSAVNH